MNSLTKTITLKELTFTASLLLGLVLLVGCQSKPEEESVQNTEPAPKQVTEVAPPKNTEPPKKTEEEGPAAPPKKSAKGETELPPAPPSSEELAVKELEKIGGKWKFNRNDNVDEVSLTGPEITDNHLVILQAFPYLSRLDLTGTSITDEGLNHLKPLKWLRYLYLLGTPITDAGVAELQGHSRLEHLCLDETKVSDQGVKLLEPMDRLVMLHLATRGEITDACIDSLIKLKDLREIKLEGTKVTEDGKARLVKAIPEIEFIGGSEESIPID